MKYYGEIGFEMPVDKGHGVHAYEKVTKTCYGDVMRANIDTQSTEVNGDITVNNSISIISNPFITSNINYARYITFMGNKWKISSIDVCKFPRIIITIRGVYEEEDNEE